VAGRVAAPGSTLVGEQDEPSDGWLASFMVAVEDVDSDATGRPEPSSSTG
jgi:hypothetical protein